MIHTYCIHRLHLLSLGQLLLHLRLSSCIHHNTVQHDMIEDMHNTTSCMVLVCAHTTKCT